MSEATAALTRKDFTSSQDVRWCPGCGDYAILSTVLGVLPKLGVKKEDVTFISGVGCSSRFPYYANTFGFHTIHGRGPSVVTGLRVANPNLHTWLVTGDGDGLSIGGNHTMHLLRRNVDVNVLLFNNQIYGLHSKVSIRQPHKRVCAPRPRRWVRWMHRCSQPVSQPVVTPAIARCTDVQIKEMGAVIERSASHRGTSFVEVLQNCVIFNDGTFNPITEKDVRSERQLWVEHGKPLVFGKENDKGIRIVDGKVEVLNCAVVSALMIAMCMMETADVSYAMILADMGLNGDETQPVAMGILRAVDRPVYEEQVLGQIEAAQNKRQDGELEDMYRGFGKVSTWTV